MLSVTFVFSMLKRKFRNPSDSPVQKPPREIRREVFLF